MLKLFAKRKLLIATKHGKEKVIAPLLEKNLGVECFIDREFDTDELGTFTGEIERALDPIATVREKCLRAMKKNNCDLALASEGSFGPHPSLLFVSADDEFLIFIDKLHEIEIIAREISTKTNFNGKNVKNRSELLEFAKQSGFPFHALILRPAKEVFTDIIKGICDEHQLLKSFDQLVDKYGSVYAETDMRAMHNPSRLNVIASAAENLIKKINSLCPQCAMPGFDVTEATKGLQCSLCGLPTNSTLSYVFECQHCGHRKEEPYPHGKTSEDPTYCDFCNP